MIAVDDSPYRFPHSADSALDGLDISVDVRSMQIITGVLMMGVVVFMLITLVMNKGAFGTEPDILFFAGAIFAASAFLAHLIVPMVMRRQQVAQIDQTELRDGDAATRLKLLLPVYRGTHMVACAFLEGSAFFNLVGYMTEQFAGSLAIAAFLLLCIAFRFPNEDRIRMWVRRVAEEASLTT